MPFTVACLCGRSFEVAQEQASSPVPCPGCGRLHPLAGEDPGYELVDEPRQAPVAQLAPVAPLASVVPGAPDQAAPLAEPLPAAKLAVPVTPEPVPAAPAEIIPFAPEAPPTDSPPPAPSATAKDRPSRRKKKRATPGWRRIAVLAGVGVLGLLMLLWVGSRVVSGIKAALGEGEIEVTSWECRETSRWVVAGPQKTKREITTTELKVYVRLPGRLLDHSTTGFTDRLGRRDGWSVDAPSFRLITPDGQSHPASTLNPEFERGNVHLQSYLYVGSRPRRMGLGVRFYIGPRHTQHFSGKQLIVEYIDQPRFTPEEVEAGGFKVRYRDSLAVALTARQRIRSNDWK